MKAKVVDYPQKNLYLVAKIGWLTCNQYVNLFYHYNKKYTEQYLQQCEDEITVAEKQITLVLEGITANNSEEINKDIQVKLNKLFKDAQAIFKTNKNIQQQFNYCNILSIVRGI
jgi:adenosylcobinamide amidohydrolase